MNYILDYTGWGVLRMRCFYTHEDGEYRQMSGWRSGRSWMDGYLSNLFQEEKTGSCISLRQHRCVHVYIYSRPLSILATYVLSSNLLTTVPPSFPKKAFFYESKTNARGLGSKGLNLQAACNNTAQVTCVVRL